MTKRKETVISGTPLTAELFDAMFANKDFQDRFKEQWMILEAKKEAREKALQMHRLKIDGTESRIAEEFGSRPDASEEAKAVRRAELHAEFERQFLD